jgi:hypothetical protein
MRTKMGAAGKGSHVEDKEDRIARVECGRIHSSLVSLKKQLKLEVVVRDRKKGKVAKDVAEAYKSYQ